VLKTDLPELKVLEYTQALQRTQNLESRGDLQNKGIYKLLITIYEWTEKFVSNRSLPGLEYLERDLGIEEEKLVYFVTEYAIRSSPPLFRKLNYVDFVVQPSGDSSHPSSHLKHFTVFCRPTVADGASCYRYVLGLNEISSEAIRRWLVEKRVLPPKEKRREQIFQSIDMNLLLDTYASSEIGSLFHCPFDKTRKLKDITLTIHIKPILKKLVDEKLLFFIRNERATQPGNRSVFYYYNKEEIFDRLDIYMEYVRQKIVPDFVRLGVINEPQEEDYYERKGLAETIYSYMNDSYGDQKTVIEEILLLHDFYSQELKKIEEETKLKNLESVLEHIRSVPRILNLHSLFQERGGLTEEEKNYILNNSAILYTEYADKASYYTYILHRENIPAAMESAIQTFRKTKSDSEITILRFMGAIDSIDDFDLKKKFEETESESFFPYLPFFTWLWRWLIGNKRVYKFEAEEIRKSIREGIHKKIVTKRPEFLAKEKERLRKQKQMSEDEKSFQTKKRLAKATPAAQGTQSSHESATGSDQLVKDPKVLKQLEEITKILDEAWDFGHYPDRVYVLENLDSSISEDELVNFIKKNGGKEIYSFMIRNQIEKFPFPILISREYLKKNGSALLRRAEKVLEEQKSAAIPDQLSYDIAVSLAEFLDRILPRIK